MEVEPEIRPHGIAPAAGATTTLRRALVVAGERFATPQDQIDCADLLLAAGFADAARLLYELALIRAGFSDRLLLDQQAVRERTRLWSAMPKSELPSIVSGSSSMIDWAVDELRYLIALQGQEALPPLRSADSISLEARDPPEDVPDGQIVPDLDGASFGMLSTRLYRCLLEGAADPLVAVFDEIWLTIVEQPEYVLAAHFNAAITDLAAMVSANGLRRFLRSSEALCRPPFGSARLFAAAARLELRGLGPYFSNVPRLIRTSRDLFGLLSLAGVQTRSDADETLERWSVMLSPYLDTHDRVGLADDFGDLGLMRGLRGLLENAMLNPSRDDYLYWAIRDSALDNGAMQLAIAAQQHIVAISGKKKSSELTVLAEILASIGVTGAAEEMLQKALAIAPHDRTAAARLDALREDRFEAYRVDRGFGSSKHRSALRMRNRNARGAAKYGSEAERDEVTRVELDRVESEGIPIGLIW